MTIPTITLRSVWDPTFRRTVVALPPPDADVARRARDLAGTLLVVYAVLLLAAPVVTFYLDAVLAGWVLVAASLVPAAAGLALLRRAARYTPIPVACPNTPAEES